MSKVSVIGNANSVNNESTVWSLFSGKVGAKNMNNPTGLEAQAALPASVSLFWGISHGYKLPSWIFVIEFPAGSTWSAGRVVSTL